MAYLPNLLNFLGLSKEPMRGVVDNPKPYSSEEAAMRKKRMEEMKKREQNFNYQYARKF